MYQRLFGNFWSSLHPDTESVQDGNADVSVMHTIDEVLPYRTRQVGPRLDLRPYSPKIKRPILSCSSLTSSASDAAETLSQRKESLLLFSLSLQALLD